MTNKELLELIKTAKENTVNVDTLRRLLKIAEQDGVISDKKVKLIKELLKEEINDLELLNIFGKSCQKRISGTCYFALNNHTLIKSYLNEEDFKKDEWKAILEFVSTLPENIVTDSIYIKWLKYIQKQKNPLLEELTFFHKVFKESIDTPFIYYNWYFKILLDQNKPLKNRMSISTLLKQNILDMIKADVKMDDVEKKARKIIKCFELYGYIIANFYATIITCITDLEVPLIESDNEVEVYKALYPIMCHVCMDDNLGKNFQNSYYYKLAINKAINPEKRLDFITIICSRNLVLKDDLVKILWNVYEEKGSDFLIELKFAFLNQGIRTNILCKIFLINEPDLQVLKLARQVFKNNRVRKDTENLCILCDLKRSEEKLEFLSFLKNKYQDDTERKKKEEQEKEEKMQDLLKVYQCFLNKKIGLEKLEENLKNTQELDIDIVRVRKGNNGREI